MAKKVLRCGQSKLWFDPNEYESVLAADSIEKVKNLIEDGTIIKKNDKVNSRANARDRKEAKSKGRHMGNGSRKGTKNARLPKKTIWIKTLRSMRSILRDMKNKGELTSEEYQKYDA
ncbi:LSU ribosomal protein L19E, partial [Enterocytozoon bieneusi H348]